VIDVVPLSRPYRAPALNFLSRDYRFPLASYELKPPFLLSSESKLVSRSDCLRGLVAMAYPSPKWADGGKKAMLRKQSYPRGVFRDTSCGCVSRAGAEGCNGLRRRRGEEIY
jgi:hypothetical protein